MKKRLFAKSIPSNIGDGYKVVLINCPTLAVYNNDGILVSYVCDIPKDVDISRYQKGLIRNVMYQINDALDICNELEYCDYQEDVTPVPDYIKRAFPDDEATV